MESTELAEVNLADVLADMWLEIEEIDSTIKIICCALKSHEYEPDMKDVDSTLFSLQGKLNCLRNNFKLAEEILINSKDL